MNRTLPLVAGLLWLALPATIGVVDASPGSPDRGLVLFTSYCAACHGEDGKGDGPMATRLKRDFNVQPTDLSNQAWQASRSDVMLRKIIREGGRAVHRTQFMPAWGMSFSESQLQDLIGYVRELRSFQHQPQVSLPNVNERLELGRTLYSLYCLACHGRYGRGDGPLAEAGLREGVLKQKPPAFTRAFMAQKTDAQLQELAQSAPAHARMGIDPAQSSWWHQALNRQELDALTLFLRAQAVARDTSP